MFSRPLAFLRRAWSMRAWRIAVARAAKKCARFSQRTSSQSCSFSFTRRSAVMASAVGVKECSLDSALNSRRAIIRSSPIKFPRSAVSMHSVGLLTDSMSRV